MKLLLAYMPVAVVALFGIALIVFLLVVPGLPWAAELTPVAGPPADWIGVGIVAGIAAISVGIVGYALFLRRPGLQPGEEAINKLLDLVKQKDEVIAAQAVVIATAPVASTPAAAPAPSAPVPIAEPVDQQIIITIPADGSTPIVVRVP